MMSYPPKAARLLGTGRQSILQRTTPSMSSSSFSTAPNEEESSTSTSSSSKPKPHPQSFVQSDIHLEAGEPLPPNFHQHLRPGPSPLSHAKHSRHANDGRDAYWRPPWKNRAEIISADDFANRPRVTFSESFESLHDAMLVLSWLGEEDRQGMYRLYLEMMAAMAGSGSPSGSGKHNAGNAIQSTNTSHEYVIRVVAQRYNVTTSRAAGVIQLQHNEEQLKKDPTFTIRHDLQAYVDAKTRENIRDVYKSYGEKDPLQFVETPVTSSGLLGRQDLDSPSLERASDLLDVDALFQQTQLNEEEEASIKIKNHIYVEDIDDSTVNVKLDGEARKLLNKGKELGGLYGNDNVNNNNNSSNSSNNNNSSDASDDIDQQTTTNNKSSSNKPTTKVPPNLNALLLNNHNANSTSNPKRPRWKYAAQIINTSKLNAHGKKAGGRIKAKRHGRVVDGNTLIEEDGSLRVATVAELEKTSWKHVRNESEFMFRGVKEAWLRRELEGEVGGWGLQEEVNVSENEGVEEKNEEDAEGEGGEDNGKGEGSEEGDGTENEDEKKE